MDEKKSLCDGCAEKCTETRDGDTKVLECDYVKPQLKTICFDFDGVIAKFDGWKGTDVFGAPHWDVINAMKQLKASGYHVIIWTTRRITPGLMAYLNRNGVPFDSINSIAHNPKGTSTKPLYHVLVDDRAIQYRGQDCKKLIKSIEHLIANGAPVLKGEENEKKETGALRANPTSEEMD
jgi:hydroxymethylpyrimidine pyrophosphatase-like HAD family hydrolase